MFRNKNGKKWIYWKTKRIYRPFNCFKCFSCVWRFYNFICYWIIVSSWQVGAEIIDAICFIVFRFTSFSVSDHSETLRHFQLLSKMQKVPFLAIRKRIRSESDSKSKKVFLTNKLLFKLLKLMDRSILSCYWFFSSFLFRKFEILSVFVLAKLMLK